MYRGSDAFQLLKVLLKPTLLILGWMSILRLLLFIAVFYPEVGMHADLPAAFLMGLRFDLLVLGFLWIPIVVLTWVWTIALPPRKLLMFWKIYLVLAVLAIFDLSWMDFFWTAVSRTRLNHESFSADTRLILDQGWKLLGESKPWIATIAMGLSSLGLVLVIYEVKFKNSYSATPKAKLALQVAVSILLVGLAARGTWTPHHLALEHAQVSSNPMINQLPLNPLWNLDK
jgi:hypothetical protein